MVKVVSALAARKRLGELLEEAYYRGDEIVIERAGKPMAVLISVGEYETWLKQRAEDFSVLDQVRAANAGADTSMVEEDVKEALTKTRKATR